MKKIFYFLAISLLLIGCEGNNPESERPLNQPCHYSQSKGQWVIDSDWTPIGHVYVSDEGTQYLVYEFLSNGNVHHYYSKNKDLSDPYDIQEGFYEGEYPNFVAEWYVNSSTITFKDTLTIAAPGSGCDYKLIR